MERIEKEENSVDEVRASRVEPTAQCSQQAVVIGERISLYLCALRSTAHSHSHSRYYSVLFGRILLCSFCKLDRQSSFIFMNYFSNLPKIIANFPEHRFSGILQHHNKIPLLPFKNFSAKYHLCMIFLQLK